MFSLEKILTPVKNTPPYVIFVFFFAGYSYNYLRMEYYVHVCISTKSSAVELNWAVFNCYTRGQVRNMTLRFRRFNSCPSDPDTNPVLIILMFPTCI